MSDISSDRLLNLAYEHVYQARQQDSPHSDIWTVSLNWPHLRTRILAIIHQMLTRVEIVQADYHHIHRGIPKGCSLSPLIAGLVLKSLDAMIPDDCFYVRYMDDWVVLTRTRRQLRRVVKRMHAIMHRLKFKLAIDKTFIGKISRGFDFLGYRFNHRGIIGLAKKTVLNFKERLSGLYESGASSRRIAQYVRRWMEWCQAGLS